MAKKKDFILEDEYEDNFLDESDDLDDDDDFDDDPSEDEDAKEDAMLIEDEEDQEMLKAVEQEDEETALSQLIMQEEIGFNPDFDFDTIPEKDKAKYDAILMLSEDEALKYAWKRITHWQKWALAMVCQRYNQNEKFREIAIFLIANAEKSPHLALSYEDIHLELIRSYTEAKMYNEAETELENFESKYPQHKDVVSWVKALLLIDANKQSEGRAILDKIALSDPESGVMHHEIGAALISINQPEIALLYLEKAKLLAKTQRNFELTTAIDNCRKQAQSMLNNY